MRLQTAIGRHYAHNPVVAICTLCRHAFSGRIVSGRLLEFPAWLALEAGRPAERRHSGISLSAEPGRGDVPLVQPDHAQRLLGGGRRRRQDLPRTAPAARPAGALAAALRHWRSVVDRLHRVGAGSAPLAGGISWHCVPVSHEPPLLCLLDLRRPKGAVGAAAAGRTEDTRGGLERAWRRRSVL